MPALFPSMAPPEQFHPGDYVRKFVTEWNVTPFCGVVTHIVPSTYKVWVQWPIEHSQESPENLIKVNSLCFGLPTGVTDRGYSSYEKALSEKLYGRIPKEVRETDKAAIRVAHTFAADVVGKLVNDIVACKKQDLSDCQAYNRIYEKYSDICSDYIIKSSIKKVYAHLTDKDSSGIFGDKPIAIISKKHAMKVILDLQAFYDHVPETKPHIEALEKILMKNYNITDKELTELSIHCSSSVQAIDLKHKAMQIIIDIQDFYKRLPDIKEPVAKIEKILAKAFDITDKELIEAGFPKDVGLFTRS